MVDHNLNDAEGVSFKKRRKSIDSRPPKGIQNFLQKKRKKQLCGSAVGYASDYAVIHITYCV